MLSKMKLDGNVSWVMGPDVNGDPSAIWSEIGCGRCTRGSLRVSTSWESIKLLSAPLSTKSRWVSWVAPKWSVPRTWSFPGSRPGAWERDSFEKVEWEEETDRFETIWDKTGFLGEKEVFVNEFPSLFIDDALFPARPLSCTCSWAWTERGDNLQDLDHHNSDTSSRFGAVVHRDLTERDASSQFPWAQVRKDRRQARRQANGKGRGVLLEKDVVDYCVDPARAATSLGDVQTNDFLPRLPRR